MKSYITEDISIAPVLTNFQKFSNVVKRVIFGVLMVSGFFLLIMMGPFMLILLVIAIQVSCFKEVLTIGYNQNKVPPSLPYFRSLSWYFLVAANYYCSIETIAPHFQDIYKKYKYLDFIIRYHRFISFCIYFVGMILFVLNLVRKYHLQQFKILAWTHMLLILLVIQAYMIIENIFDGLIWFILPVSLVILNDIFAYAFGRLWGKTPLIELSPKKTWEGFIGAFVGTIISGFVLSNVMCKFKYFVCPIEYYDIGEGLKLNTDCTPSYLFTPTSHSVGFFSFDFYPFTYHFLSFAFFASIIAPFGGFCASGFKRAFKVKDFGDIIPGHGGIMDRMDCEYLMASFINVYIFTFVRNPSVDFIFDKILYLDESSQVQFYYMLKDSLLANNYLKNSTDLR